MKSSRIIIWLAVLWGAVLSGPSGFAVAEQAPSAGTPSSATQPQSLDQLLDLVRQGKTTDSRDHQRREQEFLKDKALQQQLLDKALAERKAIEKISLGSEAALQNNEQQTARLKAQFDERLGTLKDLFAVLQEAAVDARSTFEQSPISAQYPERDSELGALIAKTTGGTQLPSIAEIEGLWYEIQREMTESGKVVKFDADVVSTDGAKHKREVVRVGTFGLSSEGDFIRYLDATNTLVTFARQPAERYRDQTAAFQTADPGLIAAYPIDPSRGDILNLLVQAPRFFERIDQGGLIGYLTMGLGLVALLMILERFIYLSVVGRRVQQQLKSDRPSHDNPLGRVLFVYENNKRADVETLELKLDEAVMKEMPPLERFIVIIKMISAAAPLLGLLGTVTGMIHTFQAMTLFGAGDPKLMAGGISQALITTVQGLVVAIPTLFAHSIISGMSRRIVHTLEQQSAGIVAVHAEQEHD